MNKNFTDIADILQRRSQTHPDKKAYTFLVDDNKVYCEYTYRELDHIVQSIVQQLLPITQPGDRVLLLYASEHLFIPAFLACAYVGAIAVPTLPPTNKSLIKKLHSIFDDCEPSVVLSENKVTKKIERLLAQPNMVEQPFLQKLADSFTGIHSGCHAINTELVETIEYTVPFMSNINANDVMFLQYTSGSTGSPKGVMVRHSSLIDNMALMQQAYKLDENNVTVTWLPVTHDMGLIGTILLMLYIGGHGVVMSPINFLFKPIRWLQAISDYKAFSSTAPNFAYRFCSERITEEQRAQLDLSHWNIAICGAEPIRPTTMRRFVECFSACGFKPEQLHCSYGLAEATLFVSCSEGLRIENFNAEQFKLGKAVTHQNNTPQHEMVSCGKPLVTTKIVNPETLDECAMGETGEVWIGGPSVCQGYWNKPDINKTECQATINNQPDHFYLRTGDLGFIFQDELYIAGRSKETIIINGENHYPQDIEESALQADAALQGCNAIAFSHEMEQQEELVVVTELQRSTDEKIFERVAQDIQAAILRGHQLTVAAVVLLPRGRLPKTTSGKLQRKLCQREYKKDQLKSMYKDAYVFEPAEVYS
ncbi:MAG: fatty acyl-AMP ligase [Gammaproteobacteria bacterium]|nr:fatty acyl-AMP ligase [Gammaproteobacteria bacterium]